jgi:predicted RNA-binding protein with PIN domain
MIVLIDGYNLLKQLHGKDSHENHRSALVNLLGRYAQKRTHKVIIFFDGGAATIPYQEKQKGIVVWFSGQEKTADDLIIEYVYAHKGKDMLIITLDRDLKNQCGLYAPALEPLLFYAKIQDAFAVKIVVKPVPTGIKKLTEEADPVLDALMVEACYVPTVDKEEQVEIVKKTVDKQLSKKQQRKNKILDNL